MNRTIIFDAAKQLEPICHAATKRVRDCGFAISFEDAIRAESRA